MNCPTCKNKGYQESLIAKDATYSPIITKCPNPNCPHTSKYYDKIREQFSEPKNKLSQQRIREILSQAIKDYQLPDDFVIDVPPAVIAHGPEVLKKYVEGYCEKAIEIGHTRPDPNLNQDLDSLDQGLNNLNKDPSDPARPDVDRSIEVPVSASRGEVHYPHLNEEFLSGYKKMVEMGVQPCLHTPFGIMPVYSLEEANRIMGILNSYWNKEKELNFADSFENVTVFPLERALGFEPNEV